MTILGTIAKKVGAPALALSLALSLGLPAAAADAKGRRPAKAQHYLIDPTASIGAFTPAAADPRLAAAFARSGLGAANFSTGAFRFTRSGGDKRRAITVAMRARAITRAEAARTLAMSADAAPSAYNLGLAVGWKRFALSGEIARLNGGLLSPSRESADVGLSFAGKRWATKIDLATERAATHLADAPVVGIDQSWSVGLGGTYALTHNINVSGGIRYKEQRDQFQSLLDDRRDSQAIYVGTTFKF